MNESYIISIIIIIIPLLPLYGCRDEYYDNIFFKYKSVLFNPASSLQIGTRRLYRGGGKSILRKNHKKTFVRRFKNLFSAESDVIARIMRFGLPAGENENV